jgi:hypothetical protein
MYEKEFTLASADTNESRDILGRLLREWSERFALGQAKYSEVEHLGPAGVFPDVNRKCGRIKRDVWEVMPVPDGAEDTRTVILEMIGHLFLMLHLYDEERKQAIGPRSRTGFPEVYVAKHLPWSVEAKQIADDQLVRLHTGAPRTGGLALTYPRRPVNYAKTEAPTAHIEVNEAGEAHPGSGWDEMPDEVKEALRHIADGDEVVSTPALRRAAVQYLEG